MKLRWFSTCDKNGVWSEVRLQYWDTDICDIGLGRGRWRDVPHVECKTWEEEEYLTREEAV